MATGKSRHTEQKDAIIEALREADDFISASDLYAQLHAKHRTVGLATVYRQLNSLAESGSADTISMGGRQLYRLCVETPKHHHHLVCEGCGKTVEIEPPDGDWMRAIAVENGFTISRHVLEVFGLCSDCQKTRLNARTRNGRGQAAHVRDGKSSIAQDSAAAQEQRAARTAGAGMSVAEGQVTDEGAKGDEGAQGPSASK